MEEPSVEQVVDLVKQGDQAGVEACIAAWREQAKNVPTLIGNANFSNRRNAKPVLHVAAMRGRAAILETLLNTKANPDSIDDVDNTPLHFAADLGHAQAAHVLLKAGAKPDFPNGYGKTPRDKTEVNSWDSPAVAAGKVSIREMMGGGELPPTNSLPPEPSVAPSVGSRSAEQSAPDAQSKACTQMPSPASGRDGGGAAEEEPQPANFELELALKEAVRRGDAATVKACLDKLGSPGSKEVVAAVQSTDAADQRRRSCQPALHLAALAGSTEVLAMLLAARANPDAMNDQGSTPLHIAMDVGCDEACRLLLATGANPEIRNNFGRAPGETPGGHEPGATVGVTPVGRGAGATGSKGTPSTTAGTRAETTGSPSEPVHPGLSTWSTGMLNRLLGGWRRKSYAPM
eukprot:gnl/TRDRNA2_/TRDRNA2_151143_c0_seq1.p1 gnl/TRDRNA2_/TRDRNA2_151143_c0~~gnl/TRDRNA2_/TRDRNA2_151143_c0_seq1.p1  ORF type:complete len:403 (-),score=65.70 gnl/TRDRNA2_/TRDRNA2_151143_c0_seq1:115-1323(-)